ncbi:uncharacterized protein E0L32_000422 [Thyridium curvatum]|uniref:Ubiquitin carboxyl-terminal hydrolase n=1 Tax=Thyridium curvatum TaxID=1093900 RepID=A0A507BB22_9PEZI|nr:uncharacterized protein E0L32_000422 [Thyridium curvatum]TPX14028.1 hypothetical protein E0L32_000422 [Thyridium curvatum]
MSRSSACRSLNGTKSPVAVVSNNLESMHRKSVISSDDARNSLGASLMAQTEVSRRNYMQKAFRWDESTHQLFAKPKAKDTEQRLVVTAEMIIDTVDRRGPVQRLRHKQAEVRKMPYRKHYTPLESNPALFTELIHTLGLSSDLEFYDVLSLDDVDLLALVPRPTLALVLVFPTSPDYETEITDKDKDAAEYAKSGEEEDVIWYKQTINNACGLYGILHAVSNGVVRDFILPDSHLSHLLASCTPLKPLDRATLLEDDEQLESAYKAVALQGDSEVPGNPEDEVDFHYVCFVKSHKNGHLYELDGDRKGPVDWGRLDSEDDVLSEKGLGVIREFIGGISRGVGFSLLALAPAE